MKEKRRYQRVRCDAACLLTHGKIRYSGQVVNISLNGALLSFNDGPVIPTGERGNLDILMVEASQPLSMEIEVVHSNFTMIGIKFSSMDSSVRESLSESIERTIAENQKSDTEHEPLQIREADL